MYISKDTRLMDGMGNNTSPPNMFRPFLTSVSHTSTTFKVRKPRGLVVKSFPQKYGYSLQLESPISYKYTSKKLRWQWQTNPLKMYFLLKNGAFPMSYIYILVFRGATVFFRTFSKLFQQHRHPTLAHPKFGQFFFPFLQECFFCLCILVELSGDEWWFQPIIWHPKRFLNQETLQCICTYI